MSSCPILVLIGPAASGKTTLEELVAEQLETTFVDIDAVAGSYYVEVGWSLERLERLARRSSAVGRLEAEREWEIARAHAVDRVVHDYPGAVVAFGAGHTSFTDQACFTRVETALAEVDNVMLVLPTENRVQALSELRRRSLASKGTDWTSSGHDFLAEWFDDQGTRNLAHAVIITEDGSPEATARRIVSRLT